MALWIDPPSGWRYGFPKIWNGQGNPLEWLVANGYPQKEIDQLGNHFYTRQWVATEEEVNEHGINT
jgi:hypothetical protein